MRKVRAIAFAGIIVIHLCLCVHYFNQTLDDPFISFRYADNLASGKGLVYNTGERVEGFSNPSWIFLMSLFSLLGFSDGEMGLLWCAKIAGIAFSVILLCYLAFKARFPWKYKQIGLLTAFLLSVNPYFALWTVGGLETPLFALLLSIFFFELSDAITRQKSLLNSEIALILLIYTRPESFILILPYLIVLILRHRSRTSMLKLLFTKDFLPLGISIAVIFTARILYYSDIFPNTYYAKTLGDSSQTSNGFFYLLLGLARTMFHPALAIPTLLAAIIVPIRNKKLIPLLFIPVLYSLFICYSGGDWMPGYRFIVHILPILLFFCASLIYFIFTVIKLSAVRPTLGVLLLYLLVLSILANMNYIASRNRPFKSGFEGISTETMVAKDYLIFARKLKSYAKPGDCAALGEAGIIPYVSKVQIIDCFGLMDKHIGKLEGNLHEKFDPEYVLEKRPEWIILLFGEAWSSDLTGIFLYVNELANHEDFDENYTLVWTYRRFRLYGRRDQG